MFEALRALRFVQRPQCLKKEWGGVVSLQVEVSSRFSPCRQRR